MRQTFRASVAESAVQTVVGYVVAVAAQFAVFPMVGLAVDLRQGMVIGAAMMVVSMLRQLVIRRLFARSG